MTPEKPILFGAPMIRAILADRKTVTRRLVKPQPSADWRPVVGYYHPTVIDRHGEEQPGPEVFGASDENEGRVCPFGEPGGRLWAKETWRVLPSVKHDFAVQYRADDYRQEWRDGEMRYEHLWENLYNRDMTPRLTDDQCLWRSSLHLYRAFSRITLEICSVRVERLAEISEEDAKAEGVTPDNFGEYNGKPWSNAVGCYRFLWESLHGPGSWASSPWVWVLEFRRIGAGE